MSKKDTAYVIRINRDAPNEMLDFYKNNAIIGDKHRKIIWINYGPLELKLRWKHPNEVIRRGDLCSDMLVEKCGKDYCYASFSEFYDMSFDQVCNELETGLRLFTASASVGETIMNHHFSRFYFEVISDVHSTDVALRHHEKGQIQIVVAHTTNPIVDEPKVTMIPTDGYTQQLSQFEPTCLNDDEWEEELILKSEHLSTIQTIERMFPFHKLVPFADMFGVAKLV